MLQHSPHNRDRLTRFGDLPPHGHNERKSEQQEQEPCNSVLNADDLVIGGKNILGEEVLTVVIIMRIVMIFMRHIGFGRGFHYQSQ